MRAIWKGAVSFGLVAISVKLYSATEEKDVRFHQVHRSDGGRIRYKKVCEVCGEEVSTADIVKGFDIGGGELVLLDEDDLSHLPLSSSRAVDVLEFVPADQIDPILYAKAYYLEPEPVAVKPYVLLRDALRTGERVAIVKVALRQREQLATLRVRDDVLVLNTMLWPDEVRTPDFGFLEDDVHVRPQELAMAASLIESMSGDFEPADFSDQYRAAVQEVIEAKIAGRETVAAPVIEAPAGKVIDLMAALKASVAQARAGHAEQAEPAPREAAPRKAAARSATKAPAAPAGTAASAGSAAPKKTAAKRALKSVPEPAKKTAPAPEKKAPARRRKTA
ncbi:Ku protein [Longispora sp. K20-0274]|uniref:non-homologous end joining protein Ku n=1 Tax=Longispora sp. K20-0274 TaxID=3088255 RepID=UPI00399A933B